MSTKKVVKKKTSETPKPRAKKPAAKPVERAAKRIVEQSATSAPSQDTAIAPIADAGNGFFLRWTARDFVRAQGESMFYLLALVVSGAVIVWDWNSGSPITLMTFIMLMLVIVLELRKQPRDIEYGISIDGFHIGELLYLFEDVRSFELVDRDGHCVVRIQLKSAFFPVKDLVLPPDADLVYLRTLLEYFMPEERQKDSLFNFGTKGDTVEDEFVNRKVEEFFEGRE